MNGKYELHLGDCLDFMRTMPDKSVDAVITDPPYNISVFFGDKKGWQEYREWLKNIISEIERLSENIFIFHSPKVLPLIADLFEGYDSFAAVRNFAVMGYGKVPNAWDIGFYKCKDFSGDGRNWCLSNTAGMLSDRVEHPTQKTVGLMNFILLLYSSQTILDPFMGSGTTGVACMQTGRRFIGCEIDPGYFEIAKKRIENAAMQERLL